MANPGVPDDQLRDVLRALDKCDGNQVQAANILGMKRSTFRARMKQARDKGLTAENVADVTLPEFPDDDVDAEEILDTMERRFQKRLEHHTSLHWFPIRFRTNKPVGMVVVGDPHLGADGCNIPLLRQHIRCITDTPNCYAVNIGDTADNWGGRLIRLYAENNVSKPTERRLARWFLQDAGVPWIVWLMGNHDEMDSSFSEYLKAINAKALPMLDWRARFRLVFPDAEVRVDAAHNHKGHSMWNELHGQIRAAHMDEAADIFVAGHHHNWALMTKEMPDGRIIHLARARGYKFIDEHAHRHGFGQQQYGASIMFVVRPKHISDPIRFIRSFADIDDGCEYLKIVQKKDGQQ
ncbi:MAG TPA: helix-turn-helix domain-containing protein [Alphaproteobacteria bacterium]|nr:helix-turn-helix domain-containing protein [Alphaproteobacteria bacterium]